MVEGKQPKELFLKNFLDKRDTHVLALQGFTTA